MPSFSKHFILVSIIIVVLLIANSSAIVYAVANQYMNLKEYLVYFSSSNDLAIVISSGCILERIFNSLSAALILCRVEVANYLRDRGIPIYPNLNISLYPTITSLTVLGPLELYQSKEYEGIPTIWSWTTSRVGADLVWRYFNVTGKGSVIAILDTGVDPNHILLAGKLRGWIEFDRKGKPICSEPYDTHGHGTWVASIAVGGNTRDMIFGIAPEADIVSALVLPLGFGTAAQVLAGLDWVLKPYDCRGAPINIKVDVVSMSFGALGNYSNIFLPAIAKLIENGIIPIAAIGNGGPGITSNPGNIWGVIGVGSTTFNDTIAYFSSYEEVVWPQPPIAWPFKGFYPKIYRKPDIVAPGVRVPGAYPGNLLAIGSGTSASTPMVAGVATMLVTVLKSRGLSGSKLVEIVYDILTTTARAVEDSWYGVLDAVKAIAKAMQISITNIEIDPVTGFTTSPGSHMLLSLRGLRDGSRVDLYMAGVKVYSGFYRAGTVIEVHIPPTYTGFNEVVAVGYTPTTISYGRTLIYITPTLQVYPKRVRVGEFLNVSILGLGIADYLLIMLKDNLLTLGWADLRGSYFGSLSLPIIPSGRYVMKIMDLTTTYIMLFTEIEVEGLERLFTLASADFGANISYYTCTLLPLTLIVEPYYVLNSIGHLDLISALPNITISKVEVVRAPREIEIEILEIVQIFEGLYRVKILPKKSGEVFIELKESEALLVIEMIHNRSVHRLPVPLRILILRPDEIICKEVEGIKTDVLALNQTLSIVHEDLNEIKNEIKIAFFNKSLYIIDSIIRSINVLDHIVGDLKGEVIKLHNELFIISLMMVIVIIATTLLAITILRSKIATYRRQEASQQQY